MEFPSSTVLPFIFPVPGIQSVRSLTMPGVPCPPLKIKSLTGNTTSRPPANRPPTQLCGLSVDWMPHGAVDRVLDYQRPRLGPAVSLPSFDDFGRIVSSLCSAPSEEPLGLTSAALFLNVLCWTSWLRFFWRKDYTTFKKVQKPLDQMITKHFLTGTF